jgi:hypothetical protein
LNIMGTQRRAVPHRLAHAVVGLAAITVASMFVAVPGANASDGSITCRGTEVLTYSPGLKMFTRTVTLNATANFGPCVSTNPAIASGTAGTPPGGVPANLSCLNLLDSSSGQATVKWNNGTTSRYFFNRITQTVGGQLIATASGAVTAGEFLGRSVLIVSVSPAPNFLDCLSPGGMTQRTGVVTLTIA